MSIFNVTVFWCLGFISFTCGVYYSHKPHVQQNKLSIPPNIYILTQREFRDFFIEWSDRKNPLALTRRYPV